MVSRLAKAAASDVLSDIPLLCIGVMGIGFFTFLFLVKKVCRMTIFLHGSSFLTFVGATLDLSRLVAVSLTDKGNTDFVNAREVLLSLAYPLLNLYVWELVAKCPKSEGIPRVVTENRKSHHAGWDRSGLPGVALKWAPVVALVAITALQLVWRLVLVQQNRSAIYVASSVLEITLSLFFILTILFGACASLSKPFWREIRPNIAPILTLSINLCLSVGNLSLIGLSDSPLGRFLYAAGIYLLLLDNLHTSLQVDSTFTHQKRRNDPITYSPRLFAKSNVLQTVLDPIYRRPSVRSKPLSENIIPPQNIDKPAAVGLTIPSFGVHDGQDISSLTVPALTPKSSSSSVFKFYITQASIAVLRPDSSSLDSRMSCMPDTPQVSAPALELPSTGTDSTVLDQDIPVLELSSPRFDSTEDVPQFVVPTLELPSARFDSTEDVPQFVVPTLELPSARFDSTEDIPQFVVPILELPPTPFDSTALDQDMLQDSESRKRMRSQDKNLRYRDDIEISLAALRELSPPSSPLYTGYTGFNTNTLSTSTMTSLTSRESRLSLSKFPNPPSDSKRVMDAVNPSNFEVVTSIPSRPSSRRRKRFNEGSRQGSGSSIVRPATPVQPGRVESTGTQWDVTSFIGDLTTKDSPKSGGRMATSMFTQSGVGPGFPRTYSQLITSPVLESVVLEGPVVDT